MSRRKLVLSRGEQALLDLMKKDAARIGLHTRMRNLAIVKARQANIPARTIAEYAGVSNVAVLLIAKRTSEKSE